MNSTFEVKSIQFNSLSIKLKNSNPLAVEAELKEIGPRYLEYQFFPYLLDCSSFSSLETDEIKTLIAGGKIDRPDQGVQEDILKPKKAASVIPVDDTPSA